MFKLAADPKRCISVTALVCASVREQFLARAQRLPDRVTACVCGRSNAIGVFSAFLEDETVDLVGIEPAG